MTNNTKRTEKAIVRFNKERGGIELAIPFGTHTLTQEEKDILKSFEFKYHKTGHYYYTSYTDEKWEQIKICFLSQFAQFPSKTDEKVKREATRSAAIQIAKEREAQAASKPAKKSSGSSAKIEALEAKVEAQTETIDKLTEMLDKLIKLQTAAAK